MFVKELTTSLKWIIKDNSNLTEEKEIKTLHNIITRCIIHCNDINSLSEDIRQQIEKSKIPYCQCNIDNLLFFYLYQ